MWDTTARARARRTSVRVARSAPDALVRVRLRVILYLLLFPCAALGASGQTPRPVLLSDPTSTRAVALDSVTRAREPFQPESSIQWGADRRTRVTLFAMNLKLQPGENASAVTAFAEEVTGRRYILKVEYVGDASGATDVSELIVRLSDDLGDVGDVKVWISYGGLESNRVRVGIGHVGDGPPDDAGAIPTQPVLLVGNVIQNNEALAGVEVTLEGGTRPVTLKTADDGSYSFLVAPLGAYTLTPRAPFYDFEPATRTLDTVGVNRTGLFFGARRRTYAIRGRVMDDAGPVKDVAVMLEGHASAVTDSSGAYAFESLPAGFAYAVDVSDPEHTYVQGSKVVGSLEHDERLDFDAKPHFVLSGRMTDAGGRGVFGVIMALTGKQTDATYTYTDAEGRYSFLATAHGDYTITPSQYQSYYAFSPSIKNLTILGSSQTNDFGATLSSVSAPSRVLEFDGASKSVDYSITFDTYTGFWPENVDLGHFFWEFWAMPGDNAAGTYMLSDGYGGAHALLFGVANIGSSEPGRYQLLGNIWNGGALTYFNSDEGPAPGEWGHYAAGWDGQYIVTYFNGVPVGRTKWSGPRRTPGPSGGGGRLYIGGSNHSNFIGRIAQVRGYEDSNPREESSIYSTFRPETVFSVGGNLLSWYFRPGDYMADLSRGYRGVPHTGAVRGWSVETFIYPCFTCPKPVFVVDPTAPNFADPEHPGTPPAPVAPPAPVPSGALVFDSFSRRNSTYALGGSGGLGSTEGGTAGAILWRTNAATDAPQPFGILNGRAVLLANSRSLAWINVGSNFDNFDVRATRRNGSSESGRDTGLGFRVVDSANYFFAYTAEGADPSARLLTVGYYSNNQRTTLATGLAMPATWTTLRVLTNAAGLLEVYADNTRVYTTQNSLMSAATGAGLYNNGPGLALANRWDNFAIFATPIH
jgi:hypothetical protein